MTDLHKRIVNEYENDFIHSVQDFIAHKSMQCRLEPGQFTAALGAVVGIMLNRTLVGIRAMNDTNNSPQNTPPEDEIFNVLIENIKVVREADKANDHITYPLIKAMYEAMNVAKKKDNNNVLN